MTDKEKLALKLKLSQAQASATTAGGTPEGYIKRVDPHGMTYYEQALSRHLPPPSDANTQATLAPFSRDERGNLQFDPSAGILGQVTSAATLPGDVLSGKAQVMDPGGSFNPETMQRTTGLGLLSTGIPPSSRMLRTIPRPGAPEAPAAAALQQAGAAGYERARGMKVDRTVESVQAKSHDIQKSLEDDGFDAINSPDTFRRLAMLQNPPEGAVATSLSNLITLRRTLQRTAGKFDPNGRPTDDAQAARRAIAELDDFLTSPTAESVVAGPAAATGTAVAVPGTGVAVPGTVPPGIYEPAATDSAALARARAAGQAIKEANANYAAQHRSDAIAGREEDTGATLGLLQRGEANAAVANSGLNAGNNLRQQVRNLLNSPARVRGFSKEELTMLRQVRDGMGGSKALRWVSSLFGGGGGLAAQTIATTGGVLGGMVGGFPGMGAGSTVPLLIGRGLRELYNRGVRKQLENVDEAIRQRSPLHERAVRVAPTVPTLPPNVPSLARALSLTAGIDAVGSGSKTPSAYDFYWRAKQEREALQAANEQMRRGLK